MRGLRPGKGAGRTETGYLPTPPLGAWLFCPLDGAPSSVMMLLHHFFLASLPGNKITHVTVAVICEASTCARPAAQISRPAICSEFRRWKFRKSIRTKSRDRPL